MKAFANFPPLILASATALIVWFCICGISVKISAFTVLLIPSVLKMIPMATLAAILFVVGYKLARPEIFKKMKAAGKVHFSTFIVTIVAICFINLLYGIIIGFIFFLIINKGKLQTAEEVSAH